MSASSPPLVVLHGPEAIAEAVGRLAREIAARVRGEAVFVVPVMNGALFFAADLLRALGPLLPVEGFGAASVATYGAGTTPDGPPRIASFPDPSQLAGRRVLVVDTVLDTGVTAAAVRDEVLARGAREVLFACLLDKQGRRRVPVEAEFVGFRVPDRFLVGYGVDAGGQGRTLPYVAALP